MVGRILNRLVMLEFLEVFLLKLIVGIILSLTIGFAQSSIRFDIRDSFNRTRIRLDSTNGIVFYDTGGTQQTKITSSVVEVRGGTTTGSQLGPNGIYLRDNAGNQRAYLVTASSPFGGGLFLQKAGGGDKFKVDTGDSDAPDSVNGYKIGGSFALNSSKDAYLRDLSLTGSVNTSLSPSVGNTYNLGLAANSWALVATNKLELVDNAGGTGQWGNLAYANAINNYWQIVGSDGDISLRFYRTFLGSSLRAFDIKATTRPESNATYDLGSTAQRWKALHLSDSLWHNGTERINSFGTGNFTTLSVNGSSRINSDGQWVGNLSPSSDNTYDLGEVGFFTRRWKNLRLQGSVIVNGTTRINSSGDVAAANLSFSGIGPYTPIAPLGAAGTLLFFSGAGGGLNCSASGFIGYFSVDSAAAATGGCYALTVGTGLSLPEARTINLNMSGGSCSCEAGEAIKSVSLDSTGTLSCTCGVP